MSYIDNFYNDALMVKRGVRKMNSVFEQLANWIDYTYETKVLSIYYDEIGKDKRPRLNIILENSKDSNKFRDSEGYYNVLIQHQIITKFTQILEIQRSNKLTFFEKLKVSFFNKKYNTINLLIISTEFETYNRERISGLIPNKEFEILKTELTLPEVYSILWYGDTATLILNTDVQITEYKINGKENYIRNTIYESFKKYDEFDYIKPNDNILCLESLENINRKYGSFEYYLRNGIRSCV